jgi:quinol monooxygenase YgiN
VIIAISEIVAPPDRRQDILRGVRHLLGPTRARPGCLSFTLHQNVECSSKLTLVQRWATRDALEKHIKSNEYRQLLELLESSAKAPRIDFHTVSSTMGVEWIEKLRGVSEEVSLGPDRVEEESS